MLFCLLMLLNILVHYKYSYVDNVLVIKCKYSTDLTVHVLVSHLSSKTCTGTSLLHVTLLHDSTSPVHISMMMWTIATVIHLQIMQNFFKKNLIKQRFTPKKKNLKITCNICITPSPTLLLLFSLFGKNCVHDKNMYGTV